MYICIKLQIAKEWKHGVGFIKVDIHQEGNVVECVYAYTQRHAGSRDCSDLIGLICDTIKAAIDLFKGKALPIKPKSMSNEDTNVACTLIFKTTKQADKFIKSII